MDSVYKQFLSCAELNFSAPRDTYDILKMKKIKNIYYAGPLSDDLSQLRKKETKIPTVLMIGNLKSTFMQDSLDLLANHLAVGLNNIYKNKKKFTLRIVGKYKPSDEIRNKLKYEWVKFTGWVPDANIEYARASFLFAPNSIAIGTRTKMLQAISSKVCVITTRENISKVFPKFKHNREMLVANDINDFNNLFESVLLNDKLKKRLINTAQENFFRNYSTKSKLDKNIAIMKRLSNV